MSSSEVKDAHPKIQCCLSDLAAMNHEIDLSVTLSGCSHIIWNFGSDRRCGSVISTWIRQSYKRELILDLGLMLNSFCITSVASHACIFKVHSSLQILSKVHPRWKCETACLIVRKYICEILSNTQD